MGKTAFQNKHITVQTFKNPMGEKMFSMWFRVDPGSDGSYRGFYRRKAKKVARWLREMAKVVEKLEK